MDYIELFYIVGIIFMLLAMTMMIGSVILAFVLAKRITMTYRNIKQKLRTFQFVIPDSNVIINDAGKVIADVLDRPKPSER